MTEEFFWSVSSSMGRPASSSTIPVLSAGGLMSSPSLQPIIASRGGKRAEAAQTPRSANQVLYTRSGGNARDNLYDDDLRSVSLPYATQHSAMDTHYHPYNNYRAAKVGHHQDYHKTRRHRHNYYEHKKRLWDHEFMWLRPSPWYIFLKFLELGVCLAAVVVSRVGASHLQLDIVHTLCAIIGFLVAGFALLVLWVRGHPTTNDCVHTTVLLCYGIAAPVLLCGAILVLLQLTYNAYVPTMAALFLVAVLLFGVDVLLMSAAILHCQCWGMEHASYPRRPASVQPATSYPPHREHDYLVHPHTKYGYPGDRLRQGPHYQHQQLKAWGSPSVPGHARRHN